MISAATFVRYVISAYNAAIWGMVVYLFFHHTVAALITALVVGFFSAAAVDRVQSGRLR